MPVVERARPCVIRDCARPVDGQRVVRLGGKDVEVPVCAVHSGTPGEPPATAPAPTG